MADNEVFSIEIQENSITEDSRLAKYGKQCPKTLDLSIFPLMYVVFDECKDFLKMTFQFTFPHTDLEIVYEPEKWILFRKWAEEKKGEKLNDMAFSCGLDNHSYAIVFINFQNHCLGKRPTEFVANISATYLEELFHVNDPSKKHKDFAESLCSTIEGFLEIKLEDKSKQALLRRLSSS